MSKHNFFSLGPRKLVIFILSDFLILPLVACLILTSVMYPTIIQATAPKNVAKVAHGPEQISEQLAAQVLFHTNEYRKSKGLKPLRWNNTLAKIGTLHSKAMGNRKIPFGHHGFSQRVSILTPRPSAVAENVYMAQGDRYSDVKACVQAWIKSKGHRKNLLGKYTDCGIGIYKNEVGAIYYTQVFAHY